MLKIRGSEERGHAKHGWLDSYHSFSFADYHDPAHMGFRTLRVINEDRIQPTQGFGTHSHRDMEIVSYVVEGALEHKDGMGNGSVIRPGDIQRMSAGTGVTHSEFNHSSERVVHLLQIWILPENTGLEPSYQEKHFSQEERAHGLRLVASRDGREGSVCINQDTDMYAGLLSPHQKAAFELREGRGAWIQVVRGTVTVSGVVAAAGDGVAIENEAEVEISARDSSEIVVFDIA